MIVHDALNQPANQEHELARCARPWDTDRYRRQLHRTTVAGTGPWLIAG